MILVKFYCKAKGCKKLLDTISEPLPAHVMTAPRDWVTFTVKRCPRHGGTFERGFDASKPPRETVSIIFGETTLIPASVLWPLIDAAQRRGKTETFGV